MPTKDSLHRWSLHPVLENSGSTPAIHAISYAAAGQSVPGNSTISSDGPSEERFKGPPVPLVPQAVTIAPKAIQPMAEEYVTEEMILGQDFGDNNFDSVSPATLKNANFFIWGWTVYSDVFRHTDPHVTEFCRKLNNVVSVPVPNSPGNLTMVWDLCPTTQLH